MILNLANNSNSKMAVLTWSSVRMIRDFTHQTNWHRWRLVLKRNSHPIEIKHRTINMFFCHLRNIELNFIGLTKRIGGSTLELVGSGFCYQKMKSSITYKLFLKISWMSKTESILKMSECSTIWPLVKIQWLAMKSKWIQGSWLKMSLGNKRAQNRLSYTAVLLGLCKNFHVKVILS